MESATQLQIQNEAVVVVVSLHGNGLGMLWVNSRTDWAL